MRFKCEYCGMEFSDQNKCEQHEHDCSGVPAIRVKLELDLLYKNKPIPLSYVTRVRATKYTSFSTLYSKITDGTLSIWMFVDDNEKIKEAEEKLKEEALKKLDEASRHLLKMANCIHENRIDFFQKDPEK